MTIIEIRKQLGLNILTTDMIKAVLGDKYKQPVIKINSMVKKGELIQLKRGLYALGLDYRTHPLNLIATANMMQKPSYVSFEYALSHHGMIPERVYTISSATSYRSYEYETELGNFSYQKIPKKAYAIGIEWHFDDKDGGYMIATKEKALCDKVQYDSRAKGLNKNEMLEYLEDDLRIDRDELATLNTTLMYKIAMSYSSKRLQILASQLAKRNKHG